MKRVGSRKGVSELWPNSNLGGKLIPQAMKEVHTIQDLILDWCSRRERRVPRLKRFSVLHRTTPKCVRSCTFKMANVATKLAQSSGRRCAQSTT
ncbi:hypothetical protein ACS0TY_022225 [Phlomoides rotata]